MNNREEGKVVEMSGDDLYKQAVNILLEGKDIPKAMHFFNLLYNHSIKDKKYSDTILFHIGSCAQKMGYSGMAALAFNHCIGMKENFHEAYNNLGCIYKNELLEDEAKAHFAKAFEIATNKSDASQKDRGEYVMNLGSMYIGTGTPHKALEYFNESEKIFKDNDMNHWNRSLAYFEIGDYAKGFDEYDSGERVRDRMTHRDFGLKDLPFWDGKPDKNKTVVLSGEQGLGDEIMFASMIPDAIRDTNIIIEAHPRLADLFRLNFPHVPVYGTRKDPSMMWPPFHKIDARLAMGSLGKFYRRTKESFPGMPYLFADPKRVIKYASKLKTMGNRPKIGISWRGGNIETGKLNRYVPLELLLPLLRLDADFISLQYDKNIYPKIKEFEDKHGVALNHWQDMIDNYDETAALVSNLDLIISVPQSVIHLAGALGTPTWQLAPYKALWQVGVHGEDPPWYKCVKNIWQDESCKWEPVIEKTRNELCSLLQKLTVN